MGGRDNLCVADRAAGLDNRANASVDQQLEAVGEGEVGIRCSHSAARPVARPPDREAGRIDAIDLAHADADGRPVARQEDRVRLHRPRRAPGKVEVGEGGCIRRLPRLKRPVRRVIAVRFDVIDTLHEEAATDLPGLDRAARVHARAIEQPQILLGGQQIEGVGIESGRTHDFGEDLGDLLSQREADVPVGGDHPAVRRRRIACVRLAVRFGNVGTERDPARIRVLDDGHARLREVIGRPARSIGVDVVVVRHRLAVQHARLRETSYAVLGAIQGSSLVRIFAEIGRASCRERV